MVKSLFAPEWRFVKWMATTVLKANVDQIGQNTEKWTVSAQDQSHIIYKETVSMMKRVKDNIVHGIFVNHGELHDNYQCF